MHKKGIFHACKKMHKHSESRSENLANWHFGAMMATFDFSHQKNSEPTLNTGLSKARARLTISPSEAIQGGTKREKNDTKR